MLITTVATTHKEVMPTKRGSYMSALLKIIKRNEEKR